MVTKRKVILPFAFMLKTDCSRSMLLSKTKVYCENNTEPVEIDSVMQVYDTIFEVSKDSIVGMSKYRGTLYSATPFNTVAGVVDLLRSLAGPRYDPAECEFFFDVLSAIEYKDNDDRFFYFVRHDVPLEVLENIETLDNLLTLTEQFTVHDDTPPPVEKETPTSEAPMLDIYIATDTHYLTSKYVLELSTREFLVDGKPANLPIFLSGLFSEFPGIRVIRQDRTTTTDTIPSLVKYKLSTVQALHGSLLAANNSLIDAIRSSRAKLTESSAPFNNATIVHAYSKAEGLSDEIKAINRYVTDWVLSI